MKYFTKLLQTFDYNSAADWLRSMFPAVRYDHFTLLSISVSLIGSAIDIVFGMSGLTFACFVLVMLTELVSGIRASRVKKEVFSSMRLSRFTFKVACYLVLIAVPYVLSVNYAAHHNNIASSAFDWLHVFLVMQIVFENTVSILENLGVIMGNDKTLWIRKIQDKLKSFT